MSASNVTENQKSTLLKCHLLVFYVTTMNHFSIKLWQATESGLYTTSSDDQLSGRTKKLQSTSQSQTCTKKRSWSLLGGLLPVWFTTASWIQQKPLHLKNTLSKSMRGAEKCRCHTTPRASIPRTQAQPSLWSQSQDPTWHSQKPQHGRITI